AMDAAAVPAIPQGPGFRLAAAWPVAADLPKYWKNGPVLEGAAALAQKKPDPADPLSKVKPYPPLIDTLPDLVLARKAEFADGAWILLGLEFKSESARKRWQKEIPLLQMTVLHPGGVEPGGRSIIVLNRNGESKADITD